jgi:hypothetical protein
MKEKLNRYIVRIVNTKDFLEPAENIKVNATTAESAASMTVDIYSKTSGKDIGKPMLLRAEQFFMIFLTEKEYFIEIIGCYECQ